MNYKIDETTLKALKDVLEVVGSEILEPTKGEIKLAALRMVENGMNIINHILSATDDEAVLNNFSQASRDRAGDLISDWSDQEQDVHSDKREYITN